MANTKPTYISLFSGCGGFDVGFKQAGYKCLGAFDINALALENLASNTKSPTFQVDLGSSTLKNTGYKNGKPDVILSGSPCQGFSTIGKRKYEDPRNTLLVSAARIAVEIMPNVFISENVSGVMSGKHKNYWNKAKTLLKRAGYQTEEMILNSNFYGVPQNRKRVFLIAYKAKAKHNFNIPQINGGTLRQALKDIKGLNNHIEDFLESNSQDEIISSKIQPGQKLSNVRGGQRSVHTWHIPEVFGKVTKQEKKLLEEVLYLRRRLRVRDFGDADPVPTKVLRSNYPKKVIDSLIKKNYLKKIGECVDLVGGFNGKYRRLDYDKPSYTVDTRFGSPKHFLHPQLNRGFTVREAARIQGFPDSYSFVGPINDQFRMIGNAVPPPLSNILGKYIKEHLIGK